MLKSIKICSQALVFTAACAGVMAGCAGAPGEEADSELAFGTAEQSVTALGDRLSGISDADFQEAFDAFVTVEAIEDGLGPVFNEHACGNCHTEGAIGGAGVQIERRFGRFDNGLFNDLDNRGGSLRQLFTVGAFTGANGQRCNAPLEVEPSNATVRNVGRLTTPLFGLGLVDALPDSFFTNLAASQPANLRGTVSRVAVILPNAADPTQSVGGTRVGRFGWKAGVATLAQFAADAYVNEMGITTQHCVRGRSILGFASESKPNGIAQPAGCDDLAPPNGLAGVPAETDEGVGSCAGGLSELQEDVGLFTNFMTFLAPPPVLPLDPRVSNQAAIAFQRAQCVVCHTNATFRTPSAPANGVPGNFAFRPFSDFLVHDMGALGDQIGNDGDSVVRTRLMRTAPLWGIRFRTHFLHDGRATTITDAVRAHGGQAAASAAAFFQNLSASDRAAIITALNTI
jgi:CxxC motif-containing protein (DUF1111 family)